MKNILTLLCCFICFTLFSQNQNLVPNGSFEQYKKCPYQLGLLSDVINWFNPNIGTPDYFNTCDTVRLNKNNVNIPLNEVGYQQTKSGNGYIGLVLIDYNQLVYRNYREYASVVLMKPLDANGIYEFRGYFSLADLSHYSVSKADIGVYLSKDSITMPKSHGSHPLPTQPQMIAGDPTEFLEDTTNWIKINMLYQAKGGEQYLTIGNFNNDVNTQYRLFNPNSNYNFAYYYIDDVSLHKVETPYEIAMDSIALYHPCHDSAAVKITNSGDSTLDFSLHPLTVDLVLKQGNDSVQTFQKIINNNQSNKGMPLKKDSSFWLSFAPLNYNGNPSDNYTLSATITMAADSFPPNNSMEVPALSSGKVSINKNILCQGDSVALYSKNVIGEAVWQFSKDLQNWQDLGFEDTLIDHPQSKGYYRLSVCNTVYSDTLAVDLDKKDVGLHALTFSNPCYDSLGVKVVNYGCYALDFTQNPLYLNFQMESGGQILQQQQKILNDNQQNPNGQPLAADSSMMVYFTNINYSNKQGNYKISVTSSMAADLYFKNNLVDTVFAPTFSAGLVSANKNAICAGDSVILFSAYASKSAVWQFSTNQQQWETIGTKDTLINHPKSSGFYRLSVCDIYSDTLNIEVKPLPPSIKNYVFEFCKPEKQTINLDSNANISTINWYAKRDSDSAFYSGFSYITTIDQSVTYFLEGIKAGCSSEERGKLEINLGGCALKIPNVFTPNGDGINDIFEYRNTFGKSINTKIYDRWGKQVVSYKGNEGWDGKGVAAGTYYYVIKADEEVYSGSVVLMK